MRRTRARLWVALLVLAGCGEGGSGGPGGPPGAGDGGSARDVVTEEAVPCAPEPGPLEALPTRELPTGYGLAEYTAECAAQLGPVPELNCYDATLIPVTVTTDVPVNADGEASGPGRTRNVTQASELEGGLRCDRPFQLALGEDNAGPGRSTSCVPYSRLGVHHGRDPQGRPTEFVYICRTYYFRAPDGRGHVRFDDLGMIGHNPATGATCFWAVPINDNPPGGTGRDLTFEGERIARPGEDRGFWKTLPDLSRSRCMGCHTNDPFLRTPVLDQLDVLPSHPQGPYWAVAGDRLNALARSTGPAREWNSHQHLASPAFNACTMCHRLSRGFVCDSLVRDATGLGRSPSTTRAFTTLYPLNAWMSSFDADGLRMLYPTRDRWNATYSQVVSGLRACCRTPSSPGCAWEDIAGSMCCALSDGSFRTLDADTCARYGGTGAPSMGYCDRPRCP